MSRESAAAMSVLKRTGKLPAGFKMVFGVPRKVGGGTTASAPSAPARPAGGVPDTEKLKAVGDEIRGKSEMNIGATSIADLERFADEQFAKAGTTVEAAIPGFKQNLKALKKMSFANASVRRCALIRT
jgi:hypothetical protein